MTYRYPALPNIFLVSANNLSDLPSPATARVNLGLGTLSTKNSPLTPGQLLRWDGNQLVNVTLDPSLTLVGNVLGLTIGIGEELREDVGLDLREDSGLDLREDPPPTASSPLVGYDGNNIVPVPLGAGLTMVNGKLTTTGGWAIDENSTGELREDNDNELRE